MEEKIEFQYIMNYKAYRRKMIATRLIVIALIAGGLVGFVALSVVLGILMPITAALFGVVSIIVSLHAEENYTVFNTRFVIKNGDKNISVPLENIVSVKYKTAFYEKDLLTGTISVVAFDDKHRKKKYKLKHVFDGQKGADYLAAAANGKKECDCENNG